MAGALRPLASALARVAASVVIVLLFLEVAIGQFGAFLPGKYRTGPLIEADSEFGWRHIPSSTTWYRGNEFTSRIDINAEGRPGPLLRVPHSGPRVLLLGDSFTEAAQVPYEEGLGGRLNGLLAELHAEVVNDGVSGYGTDQEVLVLESELMRLKPDAVVIVFATSTDVWDDYMPFNSARPTKTKPYFELSDAGQPILRRPPLDSDPLEPVRESLARSRALTVIKSGVVDRIFDRNAGAVRRKQLGVLEEPSGEWAKAWQLTEALLRRAADAARSSGVPLVVAVNPDGCQVHVPTCGDRPELARSEVPQSRTRALGAQAGFTVVDPLEDLRAAASRGESVYFPEDLHWTSRGHAIVADAVARALRRLIR